MDAKPHTKTHNPSKCLQWLNFCKKGLTILLGLAILSKISRKDSFFFEDLQKKSENKRQPGRNGDG